MPPGVALTTSAAHSPTFHCLPFLLPPMQLILADEDMAIDVGSIMVSGALRAGGPDCRLASRITFTFHPQPGVDVYNMVCVTCRSVGVHFALVAIHRPPIACTCMHVQPASAPHCLTLTAASTLFHLLARSTGHLGAEGRRAGPARQAVHPNLDPPGSGAYSARACAFVVGLGWATPPLSAFLVQPLHSPDHATHCAPLLPSLRRPPMRARPRCSCRTQCAAGGRGSRWWSQPPSGRTSRSIERADGIGVGAALEVACECHATAAHAAQRPIQPVRRSSNKARLL